MKSFVLPLLAAFAASPAAAQPAAAPAPAAPVPSPPVAEASIHSLRPAFVPWVALPLDMSQSSDPIWVKGEKPAANTIARLSLRPAESVVVEQDLGQGPGAKLLLHRALTGDQTGFRTMRDAGAGKQRIYCADGGALRESVRIPCFEDRDGDGAFESKLFGLGETLPMARLLPAGLTPVVAEAGKLSLLGMPLPLPAPVRYRPAAPADAPRADLVYLNCGKDHDRPRFEVRTGDGPSGYCRPAERVREGDPLHPGSVPDGVAVARLDEIVIQVGKKEEGAPVRLLGLGEPGRLYRMSAGRGFAAVSDGATYMQNELALQQKFDRPVLMTAGTAEVREGRREAGDVVLTVGFRHGYMGTLTQDTVIRTLLSKRSLPKGTLLYGIPMSSRTVLSYGGHPVFPDSMALGAPNPDAVRLVWCVPVKDEAEWTATCLPHQGTADRYTLLKGQKPAFEVTGFTYAANMSSNEGAVPVALQDGDFGRPLAWRFRIKTLGPTGIDLVQETMFGDELISSKDVRIPRVSGELLGMSFSGGLISFAGVEGVPNAVTVSQIRALKIGDEPRLEVGSIARRSDSPAPIAPPAPQPPATPPAGK